MSFIKNAYLPQNKVKSVIAGGLSDITFHNLKSLGIDVIDIHTIATVDKRISYHADIVFLPLGGNNAAIAKECGYLENISPINKFNLLKTDALLSEKYPLDCNLNCVIVGKYIICSVDTVRKDVLEYCRDRDILPLFVNQGYTKCSVAPVREDALITDDISVYNAVKNKTDVLYVDKGFVDLRGFDYGFIGGACGKIGRDTLAFTGRIYDDSIKGRIENFCLSHGVKCVYLSDEKIYDVGSIIPITEE